jgi:hypothetical protein
MKKEIHEYVIRFSRTLLYTRQFTLSVRTHERSFLVQELTRQQSRSLTFPIKNKQVYLQYYHTFVLKLKKSFINKWAIESGKTWIGQFYYSFSLQWCIMTILFFELGTLSHRPNLGSCPTAATENRPFGPTAILFTWPKIGMRDNCCKP